VPLTGLISSYCFIFFLLHALAHCTLYIEINNFQPVVVCVRERVYFYNFVKISHPVLCSLLYYSGCLNIDSDLRLSPSLSIPFLSHNPTYSSAFPPLNFFHTHTRTHARTCTHLHMPVVATINTFTYTGTHSCIL